VWDRTGKVKAVEAALKYWQRLWDEPVRGCIKTTFRERKHLVE
jgi:hypothetical protein